MKRPLQMWSSLHYDGLFIILRLANKFYVMDIKGDNDYFDGSTKTGFLSFREKHETWPFIFYKSKKRKKKSANYI